MIAEAEGEAEAEAVAVAEAEVEAGRDPPALGLEAAVAEAGWVPDNLAL